MALETGDPLGLDAIVSVEDSKVSITIPIEYSGISDAEKMSRVVKRMNNGIESSWSGKFGKYSVTTKVTQGSMNKIKLVPPPFRLKVNGTGGNTGTWCETDSGGVAAHEAGHLMGLEDQYNYKTEKPFAPWVGRIMGEYDGVVKEDEITMIIDYARKEKQRLKEQEKESNRK